MTLIRRFLSQELTIVCFTKTGHRHSFDMKMGHLVAASGILAVWIVATGILFVGFLGFNDGSQGQLRDTRQFLFEAQAKNRDPFTVAYFPEQVAEPDILAEVKEAPPPPQESPTPEQKVNKPVVTLAAAKPKPEATPSPSPVVSAIPFELSAPEVTFEQGRITSQFSIANRQAKGKARGLLALVVEWSQNGEDHEFLTSPLQTIVDPQTGEPIAPFGGETFSVNRFRRAKLAVDLPPGASAHQVRILAFDREGKVWDRIEQAVSFQTPAESEEPTIAH